MSGASPPAPRARSSGIVPAVADAVMAALTVVWFGRNAGTDVVAFAWTAFALARVAGTRVAPSMGRTFARAAVASIGAAAVSAAWFYAHLAPAPRTLAMQLLAPFAIAVVLGAIRAALAARLEAKGKRASPLVAEVAGAAVTMAFAAGARDAFSLEALPLGVLAGELAACWILLASARASGARRPDPEATGAPGAGAILLRAGPVAAQIAAPLARVTGGAALLFVADALATAIAASGTLAARPQDDRRPRLRVAVVLLACSGLVAAAREPLLTLALAHGGMDLAGIARLGAIVPCVLVGTAPAGLILAFGDGSGSARGTRLAATLALVVADLAATALVARPWGLPGIALVVASVQAAALLGLCVRRRRVV